MPECDVLVPHEGVGADDACETADPFGDDRVALVRHRRRPLLGAAERLLHLAYLRSREVADLRGEAVERRREHAEQCGEQRACRSRCTICVDAGSGSSPSRSHARRSTSGSVAEYVPTAPESLPTRMPSRAAARRCRSRSSANAQPASFSPKVTGSAWMPWVRPTCKVSRCSSARATTASNARSSCSSTMRTGVLHRERQRRVDDVRGGEAVVEPAPSSSRVSAVASTKAATSWPVCSSISATRLGDGATACARMRDAVSAGTVPICAQASRAASSTSSHRDRRASSDQTRAIAGRE